MKNNILFKPLVYLAKMYGSKYPKSLVQLRYLLRFHKILNLKNPQTLNEKILYLSLMTDTTEWTRLADKFYVRDYIRECGLDNILVNCYGYWNNVSDIDFNVLPNEFVLKSVQGSGDIIIVKNKNIIDIESIKKELQKIINTKYGDLEGGKHYMRIKPAIIAEELLHNDKNSQKHSTSIIDYKIWCFNGKAHYIWTCCNRDKSGTEVMTYDLNWISHPEYSIFTKHYREGHILPKPKNLQKMIEIAETLASAFPVVRVDLYNIDGKIYFGEMTFTSLGGLMDFYTEEFQNITGKMIDLNYKKI